MKSNFSLSWRGIYCCASLLVFSLGIESSNAQRTVHESDLVPLLQRLDAQHHKIEATQLCRKILERRPTRENLAARVLAHKLLGQYDHGRDERQSIAHLDQAIILKSDDADLFYLRGVVKYEDGDIQNSLADFKQAIKLDPSRGYIYRMLASAYSSLGDNQKALQNFSLALERLPETHEFYPLCLYFRAQTYEKLQRYDDAIADYARLIRLYVGLNKDADDAYMHRAACYIKLLKYDKALEDYNVLAKKDPRNDDFVRARAEVLMLKGDVQGALASYTDAIKLEPSSNNYRARARAYEKIGRHDLAELDIKKARAR